MRELIHGQPQRHPHHCPSCLKHPKKNDIALPILFRASVSSDPPQKERDPAWTWALITKSRAVSPAKAERIAKKHNNADLQRLPIKIIAWESWLLESIRYRGGTIWGKNDHRAAAGEQKQPSSNKIDHRLGPQKQVYSSFTLKFEIAGKGWGQGQGHRRKTVLSCLSRREKDEHFEESHGTLV